MFDTVIIIPNQELLENEIKLSEFFLEEIKHRLLDKELKVLIRRPSVRRQMLEKCGKDAFLLPEKLKFPVKDPRNCKYHCGLIMAAYFRANQWKHKHPEYKKIAEKAKELFAKLKCENKIGVQINEEKVMPMNEFLTLLG